MNTNAYRITKLIDNSFRHFSEHKMNGEYDKDTWKEFLKNSPDGVKGRFLSKPNGNGKYSIKNCIRLELGRIFEAKFITEKEYAEFMKKYDADEKPVFDEAPVIVQNPVDFSEYIPLKNSSFIETGDIFKNIDNIISSKMFFPMYIYGISGVGKTFNVEQSCAKNSRPYFRVQITKDTTNEDLIGSYALINGNTVWRDGPVLKAYRCGGILLLDEIDLNPSLMILQGVLENKPVYVTQTGELVYPADGFQVFATGNSKGDGNEYEYVGTAALNKAFLERFDWIVEQKMPTITIEKRILKKYMSINKIDIPEETVEYFLKWIDTVRKSYSNGDTSIYISTRRVQSIVKGYVLTKDMECAISNAMSHYDPEETNAFINVWKAINGGEKQD